MNFFGDFGRVARKGINRMVEARQRQARRYVNSTLLGLDDETLARSGFDRKQIEKQGAVHYPF
ncbi:MAG: hypothetical protein R3D32_02145 [Nitratireductor sp.]